MATKAATRRLQKEYANMLKEPPPFIFARPKENDVLEWHYILRGPPDTPYEGGEYHGTLTFPSDYPFKPPRIKMSTPSGRFVPDTPICTSFSDFHPGSWNPAFSVNNILVGLLSFMCSDEITTGAMTASDAERRALAARSHAHNCAQLRFCKIFPEYADPKVLRDVPNMDGAKDLKPKDAGEEVEVKGVPAGVARARENGDQSLPTGRMTPSSSSLHHPPHTADESAIEDAAAPIVRRRSMVLAFGMFVLILAISVAYGPGEGQRRREGGRL